jgi:HlyD family secretion protein
MTNASVRRAVTAIFLILIAACKGRDKSAPNYRAEKVDRGNITMTVTATGTVSAVTTVQIGSQVSGVIAHLYADFNSKVQRGQLLAELDPTPFQAQMEQRRADLTRAQVDAANTKINFERQRQLSNAGLAAQSEFDAARAQYDMARAQVQQAAAALRQAETNLRYTKIVSPIDGIVVDRQYDVGQTVAASFQAPTLFSIAQDLTKMQVQADVDQSDIGRVQVGQPARFTVDAYPEEEFRGRIAQMRLNAQVNQNVVSYPVIIEVPNPGERLRPKMTANVTIDVAQVRDVLRIPNAALRFKPDTEEGGGGRAAANTSAGQGAERAAWAAGDRRGGVAGAAGAMGGRHDKKMQTIYILGANNKLQPVQIRTGISDGRFTQIVEGNLPVGSNVVVGLATSKVEGPAAFGGGMGGGRRQGAGGAGGGRGTR